MNEAVISVDEQAVRREMERRVEQWLENKSEAAAKIAFTKRSTAMKLVAARRRVTRGMRADAVRRERELIETAQALTNRPRWEALPLARVVVTERAASRAC